MNYKRLSNEELSRCKYPNLIAEITESTYSICTIAEHMELGKYRKEDDLEVWGMLNGTIEMRASNIYGLLRLYNAEYEYLFSETLHVVDGKSLAYWHWYERNQKQQRELEGLQALSRIYNTLHDKLYLTGYVQAVIDYIESADDSIEAAQNLVKSLK